MIAFLMIDVQPKLFERVVLKDLFLKKLECAQKIAKLFSIDFLVTEQLPSKLKKSYLKGDITFQKSTFSCMEDPKIKKKILEYDKLYIFGMETHICVYLTVRDLLKKKELCVVADAVTSIDITHHQIAIDQMRAWGVEVLSLESLIFEICKDAKADHFSSVLSLVKEYG